VSIDQLTFTADETTMRFRQPYTTEGLNKKLAVATPPGIYRGFRLRHDITSGKDRVAEVLSDPDFNDHVAVYQTETGFSLTVRRTGGDFDLDLSDYTSQRVIIAIFASYSLGSTTSSVLRTYTEAEFDAAAEKSELIVLGAVDVPAASTAVAAADVDSESRTEPWATRAPGTSAMQVVSNGNFNFGFDGVAGTSSDFIEYVIPYWVAQAGQATGPAVTAEWEITTADAKFGSQSLSFSVVAPGDFAAVPPFLEQPMLKGYPFYLGDTDGNTSKLQGVFGEFWLKRVQAADAGTLAPGIRRKATTGGSSELSSFADILIVDGTRVPAGTIDLTVTDGDWVKVEFVVSFSALSLSTDGEMLRGFALAVTSGDYTSAAVGSAFRIDGVRLWVPTIDPLDTNEMLPVGPSVSAGARTLFPRLIQGTASDQALVERYLTGATRVIEERRLDSADDETNYLTKRFYGQFDIGRFKDGTPAARNVPAFLEQPGASTGITAIRETTVPTPASQGGNVRRYALAGITPGGATTELIAVNASYDATTSLWSQEDSSQPSYLLVLGNLSLPTLKSGFYARIAGSGTWSSGSWTPLLSNDEQAVTAESTALAFSNVWGARNGIFRSVSPYPGSNPGDANISRTANPLSNALYAKTMPKSWGYITSGGGFISRAGGFNYGVAINGNNLDITFNTTMANLDTGQPEYLVLAGMDVLGSVAQIVQPTTLALGGFTLTARDDTGTIVNLGASGTHVSFLVFAQQ
jgi:hypothetical protein